MKTETLKNKKFLRAITATGAVFALAVFAASAVSAQTAATSTAPSMAMLPYDGPAINWPEIKAASAIVYDPISNVVLYKKDADTVRPLASLSKLMTAAIVDDMLYKTPALGKKVITIKETSNDNEADFKLIAGSKWLPADLVKYMLIGSSNKAAENLANQLIPRSSFISLMNFKAKQWGLSETKFYNPTGLSVEIKYMQNGKMMATSTSGGSVSTARQASRLLWNILQEHPSLLDITREEVGIFASAKDSIKLQNTDKLINSTSTLNILAGKTGYTDLAGGNVAVVVQLPNAEPRVIVVLGSTMADRFNDIAALASSTPALVIANQPSSN